MTSASEFSAAFGEGSAVTSWEGSGVAPVTGVCAASGSSVVSDGTLGVSFGSSVAPDSCAGSGEALWAGAADGAGVSAAVGSTVFSEETSAFAGSGAGMTVS